MEYRNSSGTHFSNDFAVGVGSSHGVELTGGSTGGTIRPASDDASAALNVRAKGASGILNLGTSTGGAVAIATGSSMAVTSTHVNVDSTRLSLGGGASTTAISALKRVRVDFTVPEIAANAVATSTYTSTGLTTNAIMTFVSDALVAVRPNTVLIMPKCSTVDELRLDFVNIAASSIGTGLSTSHGYLSWINF